MTISRRLSDWQPRLVTYLAEVARLTMAPGQYDCALFVAGAVEAQTGTDHASAFRGKYKTLRGGLRKLKQMGHADHVALIGAHLAEIHPSMANPGDIAVVPGDETGAALGVFLSTWAAELTSWPPIITVRSLAFGLGSSVLVGLIAGMYPAVVASRLDPIVALARD